MQCIIAELGKDIVTGPKTAFKGLGSQVLLGITNKPSRLMMTKGYKNQSPRNPHHPNHPLLQRPNSPRNKKIQSLPNKSRLLRVMRCLRMSMCTLHFTMHQLKLLLSWLPHLNLPNQPNLQNIIQRPKLQNLQRVMQMLTLNH